MKVFDLFSCTAKIFEEIDRKSDLTTQIFYNDSLNSHAVECTPYGYIFRYIMVWEH